MLGLIILMLLAAWRLRHKKMAPRAAA